MRPAPSGLLVAGETTKTLSLPLWECSAEAIYHQPRLWVLRVLAMTAGLSCHFWPTSVKRQESYR